VKPPTKRAGKHRRRFAGEVLDVTAVADMFGTTDKVIRARVARGLIPHRRWGGRIVFLKSELLAFLSRLEGVTPDEALASIAQGGGA
jgi:hypothetical protein